MVDSQPEGSNTTPPTAWLQSIIAGLRQGEDEAAQLSALTELCELLSISTEESLTAFPIESVVPLLVRSGGGGGRGGSGTSMHPARCSDRE